jgi:asparagine synthase (glutamine-hydrolysing)
MCGFAGLLAEGQGTDMEPVVSAMTETLRHRGPDDDGVWFDASAGIGLGSRRLAIVDLSPLGHQPMSSASGRYVLAYNGEIYNHTTLRGELEGMGFRFRGRSDTEVLLAAVERWGLLGALERSNGMFAFALWDRQERRLHLARDRMGEKPLYYGFVGNTMVFASELKALRAHPSFAPEIDREALASFLRYKYVPAPRSIFRGIRKLPPGSYVSLAQGMSILPEPIRYWSLAEVVDRGVGEATTVDGTDATEELDALLRDAVRIRMEADVPLGAFLSGGIDSSTIVALMQAQSRDPVRTFTIGFHDATYDEARHARRVAEHLGTDHTELYVTAEEAMSVIPRLPGIYDEPFADSSQIPTFLVSELARRTVTVSLSGDGGDELFGGYNRYVWAPQLWRRFGRFPPVVRRAIIGALLLVSPRGWDVLGKGLSPFLATRMKQSNQGEKLHKLALSLRSDDADGMYLSLVSHWQDPSTLVVGDGFDGRISTDDDGPAHMQLPARMMYLDSVTYLPDDILTKLDRATMAVSLEGRVPYLDHRVVEFAWRLPFQMKVGEAKGKRILRQVLDRYVPLELVDRPKWGFGIPLGGWLRGPLREWAESLLDQRRLRDEGFLKPEPIRAAWREHQAGRRNRQYELWDVLMFQAWLESIRSKEVMAA